MEWSIFADESKFGIDSVEKMYVRMDEDVPEGGRGLNYPNSEEIVLTHDHPETTELFPPIIDRLLTTNLIFTLPVW